MKGGIRMDKLFFTYWIARYGKKNLKDLTDKVCSKIKVPKEIKEKVIDLNEYLFNYFYIVYYIVALNYFNVSIDKICLLVDLAFTPGTCKLFPPAEILKVQKENIPLIIHYIEKDLKIYNSI